MSNYTKLVNYIVKDSLPTGNPAKIIKGTELDNEFSSIASNMATKLDSSGGNLLNGTLSGATVATGSLSVSGTTAFTGTTAFRNATNSFFNGAGTDAIFNIDGVNGKIYGSGVGTSGNQIELNRSSDTNHPILAFTRTRGSLAAPTDNTLSDTVNAIDSYARISGVSSKVASHIVRMNPFYANSSDQVFSVMVNGSLQDAFAVTSGIQAGGTSSTVVNSLSPLRITTADTIAPFRINYTGTNSELTTIDDPYGRQVTFNTYYDGSDIKTGHLFISSEQGSQTAFGIGTNVYDSAFPVTPTRVGIGFNNTVTVSNNLANFRGFSCSPILKNGAMGTTGVVTGYRANNFAMEAGATNTCNFQYGFDSSIGASGSLGILQNYAYHTTAASSGEGTITSYQLTSNVVTVGYTLTAGQHPVVGETLEFFVPEFTSSSGSINGSRTITAVDTVALTMQFAFTATDVPLTTVVVASGWSSYRNRAYTTASNAPSVFAATLVNATSRVPALRIRQAGNGAALYIEDQTSDSSPFVIDADGLVIAGDRFARTFSTDINLAITPRNYLAHTGNGGTNSVFANYNASVASANHYFYKSRATTTSSAGVAAAQVQGGDYLGIIGFLADDGSTVGGIESARIQNRVCGLPATGNVQSETTIYQRSGTGRSLAEITGYHPVANFSSDGLDVAANFGVKGNIITSGVNLAAATIRATSALNFDSTPQGFIFSNDGTKLFIAGSSSDNIREYTLSTAWDTTTAVLVQSLSITAQEAGIAGIAFNSTGTVLYFTGTNSDAVIPVTLPTAFSLTGAVIGTPVLFSTIFANTLGIAVPNTAGDIFFSPDGLNLYITDNSADRVFQAKMTVAFDVTTATYYGRTPFQFSASVESIPTGFWLSSDGTWGLLTGSGTDRVIQFILSVPFDITTLHVIPGTISTAAATPVAELNPTSVFYRPELNRLYVMGADTDDIIEYNVPRRTAVINHDTTFTNRVVLPRMTTVERNALLNVVDGTVIYNTTTNEYNFRQAGAWVKPTMSAA